jgi:hypothetical protein
VRAFAAIMQLFCLVVSLICLVFAVVVWRRARVHRQAYEQGLYQVEGSYVVGEKKEVRHSVKMNQDVIVDNYSDRTFRVITSVDIYEKTGIVDVYEPTVYHKMATSVPESEVLKVKAKQYAEAYPKYLKVKKFLDESPKMLEKFNEEPHRGAD